MSKAVAGHKIKSEAGVYENGKSGQSFCCQHCNPRPKGFPLTSVALVTSPYHYSLGRVHSGGFLETGWSIYIYIYIWALLSI